jgi:hypothetical protein
MKTFETFGELATAELELFMWLPVDFRDAVGPEEKMAEVVGGDFHVLESEEELARVVHAIALEPEDSSGKTLADAPDSYDVCEWTEQRNFVVVVLVTNNAGGDTYCIPKEFVTDNVLKSIEMTKEMYK